LKVTYLLVSLLLQKSQDGTEIDLKLLGQALSAENEVVEVNYLQT